MTKALTILCKEKNLFKPLEKPNVKTPKSNIILCDDFSLRWETKTMVSPLFSPTQHGTRNLSQKNWTINRNKTIKLERDNWGSLFADSMITQVENFIREAIRFKKMNSSLDQSDQAIIWQNRILEKNIVTFHKKVQIIAKDSTAFATFFL